MYCIVLDFNMKECTRHLANMEEEECSTCEFEQVLNHVLSSNAELKKNLLDPFMDAKTDYEVHQHLDNR